MTGPLDSEPVSAPATDVHRGTPSAPPLPSETDTAFVAALRDANLLQDLTDNLLLVLLERLPARKDDNARRLDLLELYYSAGDDKEVSERRVSADRFFIHKDIDPVDVKELVRRLRVLAPELDDVRIETTGRAETQLVLRAGEYLCPVVEDEEIDAPNSGDGEPTTTVRSVVGALNVLLERHGVRRRLVELPTDGHREAYLATRVADAMKLCQLGHLEDGSPEQLLEFAAW